jgi:transposase
LLILIHPVTFTFRSLVLSTENDDYLFVVRDNATSHVTPKLDTFLRSVKDKLCLVPLPTYSPHLNLIERLWHYMRDNMTRSYFHVKLTAQCEAIVEWLETLPIERFLNGNFSYFRPNQPP